MKQIYPNVCDYSPASRLSGIGFTDQSHRKDVKECPLPLACVEIFFVVIELPSTLRVGMCG